MTFHRTPYWTPETLASVGAPMTELLHTPATARQAPPLVLGLVANYDAEQIAPFVMSLRATGYDGDVVLLTSDLKSDARVLLAQTGVETVAFDPARHAPYHIQNARWFVYLDYLTQRLRDGSMPSQVLFTDVRDVVFQADPFNGVGGGLNVFHENDRSRLGECPVNRRWLRTCFGDHVALELASFGITCSGTVMGDAVPALRYLIEMWNVMSLLSDAAATTVADQAVHNFVVHRKLIESLRHWRNGDHVYTLHHVSREGWSIDGNGAIRTPDGFRCPIVHQYDRHPELAEAIRQLYTPRVAKMNAA
ncbi:MAG: hypothetical protein JWN07_1508 [Hyphomicrobiales bacterium]|nr:hypothetical protein [Hyphomicrobiales bacterium]